VSLEDFDIDSLAAYLHLTPQQVMRLADRGKLPGRKVGGSWRFSQAEVHHWLEDRIGLSDEEELAQMEGVLQRSHAADDAPDSIARLLHREAIAVPLTARTRNSVITAMTQLAAKTGLLWDPERMADAVRERERSRLAAPAASLDEYSRRADARPGPHGERHPVRRRIADRRFLSDLLDRRPHAPAGAGSAQPPGLRQRASR
jgi:excisionase family DNA binding protein